MIYSNDHRRSYRIRMNDVYLARGCEMVNFQKDLFILEVYFFQIHLKYYQLNLASEKA